MQRPRGRKEPREQDGLRKGPRAEREVVCPGGEAGQARRGQTLCCKRQKSRLRSVAVILGARDTTWVVLREFEDQTVELRPAAQGLEPKAPLSPRGSPPYTQASGLEKAHPL